MLFLTFYVLFHTHTHHRICCCTIPAFLACISSSLFSHLVVHIPFSLRGYIVWLGHFRLRFFDIFIGWFFARFTDSSYLELRSLLDSVSTPRVPLAYSIRLFTPHYLLLICIETKCSCIISLRYLRIVVNGMCFDP